MRGTIIIVGTVVEYFVISSSSVTGQNDTEINRLFRLCQSGGVVEENRLKRGLKGVIRCEGWTTVLPVDGGFVLV